MLNNSLYSNIYTPDVLSCLANLSNDEVFTPPEIANRMLDLLPQELFASPETKFLDPACKSGVFLREIAKRLLTGLEPEIPDLQQRVDHIFRNQLFGIAITELTSLLSRRSVYCSKYPNGGYSVTGFADAQGNIRFTRIQHQWKDGRCIFCGASQGKYDRDVALESHAYELIHTTRPEEIFKMKFDVIIGNPPYQLNVGIEQKNFAVSIYQHFVQQAIKINPRYIAMIIPARWYAGGRGLDQFRIALLNDPRIRILHDFPYSSDCFPGVEIKGGVCYFLWDRENKGVCEITTHKGNTTSKSMKRPLLESGTSTFIRFNESITIFRKVQASKEKSLYDLVSVQTPFGIITSFINFQEKPFTNSVKFYTNNAVGFVDRKFITKNINYVEKYKVYISAAYGAGEEYPHQIINKPFIGKPNSCCSQTYLVIGPTENELQTKNLISYIQTKFFRFMVMLKKNAQHNMRDVFEFVPIQDFTKSWTDKELYAKYGLTEEEIAFIESMIKPMDLNGGEPDAE